MKLNQKFGLGIFLCLSIFMIITAIIRISAISTLAHAFGVTIEALDPTWRGFWQQVEACIAVLMVSFTAFRSIFIAESSRNRNKGAKAWYASRQRILNLQRKIASEEQGNNGLPSIPSPTLTGLRTFIHRGAKMTTLKSDVDGESLEG